MATERLEILRITPQAPYDRPTRKMNFRNGYRSPSYQRQVDRLNDNIRRLHTEILEKAAQLQEGTQGIDPEFVLVFEVIGSVNSFMAAAQKAGMDWLGEYDEESIEADDDFYELDVKGNIKRGAMLPRKMYLTLTNQQSMSRMLSLWEQFQNGAEFEKGTTGFRDVFKWLKNIRRWNVEDRLDLSDMPSVWESQLQGGEQDVKFEIELWYRSTETKRDEAERSITQIIEESHGRVVKRVLIPEIAYHALIVECPAQEIRRILDTRNTKLVQSEQIMFFHATGQTQGTYLLDEDEGDTEDDNANVIEQGLPTERPVVALLDGLPLQNHSLLHSRIDVDDFFNLEPDYIANQRSHGTAMASLIIYGDLSNPLVTFNHLLYVLPIMKYDANAEKEIIPRDELFADVLHRAVRHIMEETDLRNDIKVINLSVVNENRMFVNSFSPEARMVDYLSWKYNILFVICAGNYKESIADENMTYGSFMNLGPEEKQSLVIKDRFNLQQHMRIQAPSEAVNALCIGAVNMDNSQLMIHDDRIFPVIDGFPATYSRFGGGYMRAIKPDCVTMGGRETFKQLLDINNQPVNFRPTNYQRRAPGLSVAGCDNINQKIYSLGTSDATALISRMCADLLPIIRQIPGLNLPHEFEAIAMKTMLIHSCKWGTMGHHLMDKDLKFTGKKRREYALRWIGYGIPNINIASYSTPQRVVMAGYGLIEQNKVMEYRIPLPPSLISRADDKRLTITLGWHSPIAPSNKNYKLAKLSFSSNNAILDVDRSDCDQHAGKRGTIQHEVYEGKKASTFVDGDSLVIKVDCKKEDALTAPVKYFLMVSLEVRAITGLPIYQEIQEKLHVAQRVHA